MAAPKTELLRTFRTAAAHRPNRVRLIMLGDKGSKAAFEVRLPLLGEIAKHLSQLHADMGGAR